MDPRFDDDVVSVYSAAVGVSDTRKGHSLFFSGAVHDLSSDPEVPWSYSATVCDGAGVHSVELQYDDVTGWSGDCDCDTGCDCRHCMALLYATRSLPKPARPGGKRRQSRSPDTKKRDVPRLIVSPLSAALEKAHGRQLTPQEAAYVLEIRRIREQADQGAIQKWHLARLVRLPGVSWDPVDLCPVQPKDDFQCWQYIARIIRQNGCKMPPFMEPVTDPGQIEKLVARWEREKEIAKWRQIVRDARCAAPLEAETAPLKAELRLRFQEEQVDVEWRSADTEAFHKCREKDLDAISEAFSEQTLSTSQASERLFMLLMTDMDGLRSSLNCRIDATLLNLILGTSDLAPLTVGPSGRPLRRAEERLRIECIQPDKPDGEYLIRLVMPDGKTPGAFIGTLQGPRDWLYLTEDAVYKGPPHHGLSTESQVLIPAAAIESADGYRFFRSKNIAVPPRVAELVRVIKLIPTAACSVGTRAGFQPSRELRVALTATGAGAPQMAFRESRWVAAHAPEVAKESADKILVLDDESMQQASAWVGRLALKWDGGLRTMYRRWPKTFPDWFVDWVQTLPSGIELQLDPELKSLLDEPVSARLRLEMTESEIDWFDVKVVMDVSDTKFTPQELALLLKASGKSVFLPRISAWKRMKTEWTDDDGKRLAKIGFSPEDLSGEPHRVHVLQLADEAASKLLPPEHADRIRCRIEELKTRVTPPVPQLIKANLRPYQVEGFHFLAYLSENRFGGVLADDMGLGKTLQTLAWLAWLRTEKAPSEGVLPSLVVCPKSVMDNWHAEAARFFPSLRVVLWATGAGANLASVRRDADLVVMNYSQMRLLDPATLRSPWFAAVLDEAQVVKNPNSMTAQASRSIVATYRLALTGTPIENRLMDLWSIMAYAMPGALGNRTLFAKRFASQEDPLARGRLAARVRPFLIRRKKEEVAKDLPERVEEDVVCEMEDTQHQLYQAELKAAQQLLLGVKTQKEFNRDRFNFLTSLLRLRQICCHPSLVGGQYSRADSAKLEALIDLVEPLMEEGHKVLVFSQFVRMLDLIQKRVEQHKWPFFMLTGDTENRGELVRSFQEHKGGAVFLLSLKAGGFGLNLTAANYVVLYDPWWNPAVERQAIDRTHRIGQVNPVNAYRLIAKNSIEQKIRLLQQRKSALAEAVLGDERFGEALTLDDLRFILQD